MDLNEFLCSLEDDSYLEHHGVKGMKWGVQKNKSKLGGKINRMGKRYEKANDKNRAGRASKYLNKLSYKKAETDYDARRYSKKADVAKSRGKNRRAERFMKKSAKNVAISKEAQSRIDSTLSKIKKQNLSVAINNVYTKHTRKVVRNTALGALLLSPMAGAVAGVATYATSPELKSKNYDVKSK